MKAIPHVIEDYEFERQIGRGTFAVVWLAYHKITKTKVAIKMINKHNVVMARKDQLYREIELIRRLDHPLISAIYQIIEDENYYYIVMEYVEGGDILSFVNNNGKLDEQHARHYFCQLISCLEYLHVKMNICHRDLKAENILLDRHNSIRLIDFGLSNSFSAENPYLSTICGSPAYAAPEMLRKQKYTSAADVWSVGIVLYAMVMGELPFQDDNTPRLMQKIIYKEPKYPSPANGMSLQLRDLLRRLLQKDPMNRLSLEQIKFHPWFSHYEYSKLMNKNFGEASNWRVYGGDNAENSIDIDITQKMQFFNIDIQNLAPNLLKNEFNKVTAVYRMLYKEKITDEMAKTIVCPNNEDEKNYKLKQNINLNALGTSQLAKETITKRDMLMKSPQARVQIARRAAFRESLKAEIDFSPGSTINFRRRNEINPNGGEGSKEDNETQAPERRRNMKRKIHSLRVTTK